MPDEKELAISIPGEWALKKAFGPVLGELGEDMKKLYATGRDKIITVGYNKISNKKDGKSANLRVARDVFWNGSFTDEAICAEYFGGILASSRSEDGKNDIGVYYVDLIKSLSSNQLKLHYLIHLSLNKYFTSKPSKSTLNIGQENELSSESIFLSASELIQITGEQDTVRDLHAIYAKGLIGHFQQQNYSLKDGRQFTYLKVSTKPLGVQLYAVAHNKLEEWRNFAKIDFGNFNQIGSPKSHGQSIKDLLTSAGLNEDKSPEKEIKNTSANKI